MNQLEKLQDNVRKAQEALDQALKEKTELELLGPIYYGAVVLHDKQCHSNHDDQCGWFYEISKGVHDWNGYAHQRYLEVSKKLYYAVDHAYDSHLNADKMFVAIVENGF